MDLEDGEIIEDHGKHTHSTNSAKYVTRTRFYSPRVFNGPMSHPLPRSGNIISSRFTPTPWSGPCRTWAPSHDQNIYPPHSYHQGYMAPPPPLPPDMYIPVASQRSHSKHTDSNSSSRSSSSDSSEYERRKHRSVKRKHHRHSKRSKQKRTSDGDGKRKRHNPAIDSISHNFIKALNKQSLQTAITSQQQQQAASILGTEESSTIASAVPTQPPPAKIGLLAPPIVPSWSVVHPLPPPPHLQFPPNYLYPSQGPPMPKQISSSIPVPPPCFPLTDPNANSVRPAYGKVTLLGDVPMETPSGRRGLLPPPSMVPSTPSQGLICVGYEGRTEKFDSILKEKIDGINRLQNSTPLTEIESDMSISDSEERDPEQGGSLLMGEKATLVAVASTLPNSNTTADVGFEMTSSSLPPPEVLQTCHERRQRDLFHLCVGDLKSETSCQEILHLLSDYGTVAHIRMVCLLDRYRVAVVSMVNREDRDRAVAELSGKTVACASHPLHVRTATHNWMIEC